MWTILVVLAAVVAIAALSVWAGRGRAAGDQERSSNRARFGGGGGGL